MFFFTTGSSTGRGGATHRSFTGFTPKIVSRLLLNSASGIVGFLGLSPLLILLSIMDLVNVWSIDDPLRRNYWSYVNDILNL